MRLWTVQPRTLIDQLQKERSVEAPWLPHSISFYSPNAVPAVAWMAYEMFRRKKAVGIGGMFWLWVTPLDHVLRICPDFQLTDGPPTAPPEYLHKTRGTSTLAVFDIPDDECLVSALPLWETAMSRCAIVTSLEEDERLTTGDPPSFEYMCGTWQRMFDRSFTADGYYGDPEEWLWQATVSRLKKSWIVELQQL